MNFNFKIRINIILIKKMHLILKILNKFKNKLKNILIKLRQKYKKFGKGYNIFKFIFTLF